MAATNSLSSTTKKPRKSRPIESKLSTEFVHDSDDSDTEVGKNARGRPLKSKNTAKQSFNSVTSNRPPRPEPPSKKRKISHSDSASSESEEIADEKLQSSSEDDSESETSSRDSSPTPKRAVASNNSNSLSKKASNKTTIVRKPDPVQSIHANSSLAIQKSQYDEGKDREDAASRSDESGSESEGESGSESSEKSSPNYSRSNVPPRQEQPAQPKLVYKPPPGFASVDVSAHPSSKILEVFDPSNLNGKEVWHITAPASVPLASVKGDIENEASVVAHKDAEYRFISETGDSQAAERALILPSFHSNDYRLSKTKFTKTLHLQQLVKLPNRSHETHDVSTSTVSRLKTHVKAPRQQPAGLKMRYRPFGASTDSDPASSEILSPKISKFRPPQSLGDGSTTTRKKRKDSVDDDRHVPDTSPTKRTKTQKDQRSQEKHSEADGRAMNIDLQPSTTADTPSEVQQPQANGKIHGNDSPVKHKKRKKESKRGDDNVASSAAQSILPVDVAKEAATVMPEEVVNQDVGINKTSLKGAPNEEKSKRKESTSAHRKKIHEAVESPAGSQSPKRSSPQKQMRPNGLQTSSQNTLGKETKEERARRKEARKKRKVAPDSQ
ncbi:hypothetical protein ACLMJK_000123 [Lecanora helva]